MPSLSEILKNKTASDQQRTESRRAERENLSEMRSGALMAITTKPELYEKFLTLQADNISMSAGNVALAIFQLVEPTKIGTRDFWHKQGRYVVDEEMNRGAKVFVPPRNPSYRGYLMGDYYDVSQTAGKPLRESTPLTADSERMDAALAALLDSSPVGFVENTKLDMPAIYNERECVLEINTEYGKAEVFAALAVEISYARMHDRGRNRDFDRDIFSLNAESIGYMVCRRFGVDCPAPGTEGIEQFYSYYTADERGKALDLMRQTARNMGDSVERGITPRQQERGNNRGNAHRQYSVR